MPLGFRVWQERGHTFCFGYQKHIAAVFHNDITWQAVFQQQAVRVFRHILRDGSGYGCKGADIHTSGSGIHGANQSRSPHRKRERKQAVAKFGVERYPQRQLATQGSDARHELVAHCYRIRLCREDNAQICFFKYNLKNLFILAKRFFSSIGSERAGVRVTGRHVIPHGSVRARHCEVCPGSENLYKDRHSF